MMRIYCIDNMKQWKVGIPSLISAARRLVQEFLGFNPFEILFGYSVRSSSRQIMEKLLKDDATREHQLDYAE